MMLQEGFVPAYYLRVGNRQIPFLVSLLLYDEAGNAKLLPAVETAINKTIEITGCEGLVTAILADNDDIGKLIPRHLEKLMPIEGAILLLRCQSAELAEKLMHYLQNKYELSLIRYTK